MLEGMKKMIIGADPNVNMLLLSSMEFISMLFQMLYVLK